MIAKYTDPSLSVSLGILFTNLFEHEIPKLEIQKTRIFRLCAQRYLRWPGPIIKSKHQGPGLQLKVKVTLTLEQETLSPEN